MEISHLNKIPKLFKDDPAYLMGNKSRNLFIVIGHKYMHIMQRSGRHRSITLFKIVRNINKKQTSYSKICEKTTLFFLSMHSTSMKKLSVI